MQSPTMLKSYMKEKPRGAQRQQQEANPFKFIELALNEAKTKIDKMKNTPAVLDSLTDVSKVYF
jgi:hypothetical protein